jgi:GAF domain-containing protein
MDHSIDTVAHVNALYEISTLIESVSDPHVLFNRAMEVIRDIVGCHSASLYIMDDETGNLNEAVSLGGRVDVIGDIPFDSGAGPGESTALEPRTVLLQDPGCDTGDGYRSRMSTPMLSQNSLIGVINLGHKEIGGLSEAHIPFMEIVAAQLAAWIGRTNYERRLMEQTEALIEAREVIEQQRHAIVDAEKCRKLGRMAASINHDINNPLTTIIGTIDLLLITTPDMDPKIKDKLTITLNEAHRIVEIVKKFRNDKSGAIEDYLEDQGETVVTIEPPDPVEQEESST